MIITDDRLRNDVLLWRKEICTNPFIDADGAGTLGIAVAIDANGAP